MNSLTEAVVTIFLGIIGVATLALILSKKADTANVIQNIASGFGNSLNVALSPVTGNDTAGSLAYVGGNNQAGLYGTSMGVH